MHASIICNKNLDKMIEILPKKDLHYIINMGSKIHFLTTGMQKNSKHIIALILFIPKRKTEVTKQHKECAKIIKKMAGKKRINDDKHKLLIYANLLNRNWLP